MQWLRVLVHAPWTSCPGFRKVRSRMNRPGSKNCRLSGLCQVTRTLVPNDAPHERHPSSGLVELATLSSSSETSPSSSSTSGGFTFLKRRAPRMSQTHRSEHRTIDRATRPVRNRELGDHPVEDIAQPLKVTKPGKQRPTQVLPSPRMSKRRQKLELLAPLERCFLTETRD